MFYVVQTSFIPFGGIWFDFEIGGTSGIGEATVRMFAKEGAKVAFTGRRKDKGLALQASVPGSLYIEADHTKYQVQSRYRS